MLASFLMAGALLGLAAGEASATPPPACTTTHTATTCAATLTVTSPAALGAHGNAANRLSSYGHGGRGTYKPTTPLGSITGTVGPTGTITGVTIPKLYYHLTPSTINTHSTETIVVSQPTAGTTSGTINSTGVVTLDAALQILVTVKSPATQKCRTSPHVVLQSTSPYDPTTKSVTLSDTTFTIPNFTPSTCGLAAGTLNNRFAGSTGNDLTLGFHGTLPIPPPPAAVTTTTLATTPTGSALAGTSVTLTATVTSTTSGTVGTTGATVKFMAGTTQIGLPQPLVAGTASLTTSSLPAVPGQQLTTVYSGNSKFAPSTSAPVTYTVKPTPTISATLPASVVGNSTAFATFTLTVTNPSSGQSYTQLYLKLNLSGLNSVSSGRFKVQYQDVGGTWCTLLGFSGSSTTIAGYFAGRGTLCTPTYPASFSLATGAALLNVPFRIQYLPGTFGVYGSQVITATLSTGTCTSATMCTSVAPLTGTAAPVGAGSIQVVPATKLIPRIRDVAPRRATSAVYKTFNVPLRSLLSVTTTTTNPTATSPNLSAPTGTVTYAIDGTVVATKALPASFSSTSETPLALYNTTTLSTGQHTLVTTYSGDNVYQPASLTETFTVLAPPTGTPFSCIVNGVTGTSPTTLTLPAYVTTSSTPVPGTTLATTTRTIQANNVKVTMAIDPAAFRVHYNLSQTPASLEFAPTGNIITSTSITFTGTTGTPPAIVGTWTASGGSPITVTVPVEKGTTPGTTFTLAESSIAFSSKTFEVTTWDCMPVTSPAPLATVTVAGTTLAGSPANPITSGTPLTLTASVFPAPASNPGTVAFTDTVGGTATALGTVAVSSTTGTASLQVTPALGAHSYTATWSGTLSVPKNTSNTLTYSVDTAPAVTTQPADQTVNAGQTASLSATASGTPAPTVQWQLSTDGGAQWTTVTGATGTTYATPATTGADNGDQYRAVFTNGAGSATTDAATLVVVVPPTVVTQPANQSVQTGSPATFGAKATGSSLGVQWQISTDGGSSWSNAPGSPNNTSASATTLSSSYTTPPTSTANNGNQYRAVFSNGAGSATSSAATLSVTTTPPPPAPPAPPANSGGYRLVAANGAVYSYGNAPFYGSMGGQTLNKPIVGTATTPGDGGYWLVASDGGIFSFGNAAFYGSMGGKPLNQPIVGIAATPDGQGYWEVASDGGIFAFGDAAFYGSMGGKPLNKPIVSIAATPDGKGYWEVASDGGIFAFGDATFNGSTGSLTLNKPIVGLASTNNGAGYWLVASDGGVFSFGNAGFHGTVAGTTSASIVSLVPTADNGGYWETASNGQVFQFGDATSAGTALAQTATIVAMSD